MDINDVKTDLDAAEDGMWFPFGADGAQIKIAMWHNKEHKSFLRKIYTKYGRKIDAGILTDQQSDEIMLPQWLHIVKDWSGFTDGGDELPFSGTTLLSLASNEQYKSFFQKIAAISKEEENFRIANVKDMGEDLPAT